VAQFIDPEGIYKSPTGGFRQVVKVGNLAIISGQTAQDPDGELVGGGDPEAQAEKIMQNLNACLAALGVTYKNVVKTTVYHTDRAYIQVFRDVRRRHWPDHGTAATSLIVSGLDNPGFLMEVEAIVELPG
jgi:enamine deaminase RidA (YjgF/YER057c/UK114 family)